MANVEPINTSSGNMNGAAAPQPPTSNRCPHRELQKKKQNRLRPTCVVFSGWSWSWKLGNQPLNNCLLTRFEMKRNATVEDLQFGQYHCLVRSSATGYRLSIRPELRLVGIQRGRRISVGQRNKLHVWGNDSNNFACKWQTTTTWKHQLHLLLPCGQLLARITCRSSRSISALALALALAPAFKMRLSLICW